MIDSQARTAQVNLGAPRDRSLLGAPCPSWAVGWELSVGAEEMEHPGVAAQVCCFGVL